MKTEVARPVTGIQVGGTPLEEAMQRGVAASEAGDKDTAYAIFRQLTAEHPGAMEGWVWLGWTSPDVNESEAAFRRAHDIDPSNEEANLGLRWVASQREMMAPEVPEAKEAPVVLEVPQAREALQVPDVLEVEKPTKAPRASKGTKASKAKGAKASKGSKEREAEEAPVEAPLPAPPPTLTVTEPALTTGPFPGTGPVDATAPFLSTGSFGDTDELGATGPMPGTGPIGAKGPIQGSGPITMADLAASTGSLSTTGSLVRPVSATGPTRNTGAFKTTGSLGSGALATVSEATQVLPTTDTAAPLTDVLVAEPQAPPREEPAWDAEDTMRRGVAAAEEGDKFAAYDFFQQIVAHDPTRADAWVWLGGTSPTLDDSEMAFKRALDADPDNEEAMLGLRWVTARRRAAPADAASRQAAAAVEPERPDIEAQVAEMRQEVPGDEATAARAAAPEGTTSGIAAAFARFWRSLNTPKGWVVLAAVLVILWAIIVILFVLL